MKKALFLVLLIISCNQKDDEMKRTCITSSELSLSPLVDSLLVNFILKNKAAFYVIFFDKKDDNEYRLTFAFSTQKVSSESIGSLYKITIFDTIPVYLFSGIEDFFYNSKRIIETNQLNRMLVWNKSMSYVHTVDTSYAVYGDNLPFMLLRLKPTIIYSVPDSL